MAESVAPALHDFCTTSAALEIFASPSLYTSDMGGERGSTVTGRLAGLICYQCGTPLAPPPPGHRPGFGTGERACSRHGGDVHIVQARFERAFDRWNVDFSANGKLICRRIFADSGKIEAMCERGGAFKCLADRQAVEFAISKGLGIVTLRLNEEQWRKLTQQRA